MELFSNGTPLEVAVLLAILYFSWNIARSVIPFIFKGNENKMDDILSKLDSIVDKLNIQITHTKVHDVRLNHVEEELKNVKEKLEKDE